VVRVLGVPYAVAERFEAPRPAPPAVGDDGQPVPFLAFERAPASPQLASPAMQVLFDDAARGMVDSEHCQALSITLPADLAPGERLPVMVWIHGGAYVNGAGSSGSSATATGCRRTSGCSTSSRRCAGCTTRSTRSAATPTP
jgi:para-nitrobenzyl esterase